MALQEIKEPKAFSQYFMRQALVNRPARKLFEAWLRKDQSVWPRLFKVIHENKESSAEAAKETAPAQEEKSKTES